MQFDNKHTMIRIYLYKMIQAVVTVALIIGIMATGWFENEVLGLLKREWIIIITIVYLGLVILNRLRRLNYFYVSDAGDKILIRYYPVTPIVLKKKAIQIPKIELAGFEINKRMMGLRRDLVIKQKFKGKIATYPSIGITALNSKETEKLRNMLEKYVRT